MRKQVSITVSIEFGIHCIFKSFHHTLEVGRSIGIASIIYRLIMPYSGSGMKLITDLNSDSYMDLPNTTVFTSGAKEASNVRELRCNSCFTVSYR